MNKNISLTFLMLIFCCTQIFGQAAEASKTQKVSKPVRKKQYHANIKLTNGENIRGFIKLIGDSSFQLVGEKRFYPHGLVPDSSKLNREVHYEELLKIKIRRIKQFKLWTNVGMIAGCLIGLQISLSSSSEPDSYFTWLLPIFLGGVIGSGAGAIIDSSPKGFEIKGQYSNFQVFKSEMKKKK